jgi:hypothetical protein
MEFPIYYLFIFMFIRRILIHKLDQISQQKGGSSEADTWCTDGINQSFSSYIGNAQLKLYGKQQ